MKTFDHSKLVNRDWHEVEKVRKYLMSAEVGKVDEVAVIHKANGSCCKKEPWTTTFRLISEAVKAPVPTIVVELNKPGTAP